MTSPPPALTSLHVDLVHESGDWAAFLPGMPISGSGCTAGEALGDLVAALREYADDWVDHLGRAPNHRRAVDLVDRVRTATDAELRTWLAALADG
jgi:hypothetical protein